jgi:hypothetical protein
VVEHFIGNEEAEGSILSSGTTFKSRKNRNSIPLPCFKLKKDKATARTIETLSDS